MATYTENYNLIKPDQGDVYNIEEFNDNATKIDAALRQKVSEDGGDISSTAITTLEESAEEFPVPVAGDSTKTFFGKVKKFIQDFKNWHTGVLTIGMIVNNAVTDNSGLPVSAAVAKALQDQLTQLYSDYVSRTKDNTVDSQLQLTKNNGIDGSSYAYGPVWLRADYASYQYVRAQIGFENRGRNAITLWLDIDGRLKATDNGNTTKTLATTDEIEWTEINIDGNSFVSDNNVKGYYNPKTGIVRVAGCFIINGTAGYKNAILGVSANYTPAHSVPCQMFNVNNFVMYDLVLIGKNDDSSYAMGSIRMVDNLTLPYPINCYVDFSYKL